MAYRDSKNTLPSRKSPRIFGHNYSDFKEAVLYFITICSAQGRCIFGEVVNDKIELSPVGQIINQEWLNTPKYHAHLRLDLYVIMPNHIHLLALLLAADRESLDSFKSLPEIIGSFKSGVVRRARKELAIKSEIWQTSFYDKIINTERKLEITRDYIINNPAKWNEDRYFTQPGNLWLSRKRSNLR